MNSGIRDLIIFIILVCIGFFIWNNKSVKQEIKEETPSESQQELLQPQKSNKKKFDLKYSVTIETSDVGIADLFLTIPVPVSVPLKQSMVNSKFQTSPNKLFNKDDTQYANFVIMSPQKGQTTYTMSSSALVKRYDFQSAQKNVPANNILENKIRYLKAEKYIEVDSSIVQNASKNINGNSTIEVLQSIADYMFQNLNLRKNSTANLGAEATLTNKSVSIGDYAYTFVALCRAKKIPARIVSGYKIAEKSGISSHHAWVEVFFQQYGWVTVDPYSQREHSIAETEHFYLTFSNNSFNNYEVNYTYKNNSYKPNCRASVDVKITPVG